MYELKGGAQRALTDLKYSYVNKANSIMELAMTKDKEKAVSLVDKRYERFGHRSLINIGYGGHLKSFIANEACQEAVRQTWQRGFVKINPWISIVSVFFPILVLSSAFHFQPLGDDGGNLSPWQKLFVFYRAPMVKYIGTFVSYVAFILLYSSVALFNFNWEFQASEIVLYIWIAILIVDEIREVYLESSSVFTRKVRDHLSSVWNKFDFIIYLTAILGFILKCAHSQVSFQVSRVLFAINAAMMYIRLFRIYHVNWNLGPKLVIFHRMIPEIIIFLMLLLIFILGYGVASQALLNPYTEFQWSALPDLVTNVIFLPYWQMYGELSIEDIQHPEGSKAVCYAGGEICEDFTAYNYVLLAILAIYLLIGNVMLLNLLIAIFTSVFEDVRENSMRIWKYEMYRLVEEYDQKPGLAPPLVIFEDAYRLIKLVWKKTCRKSTENLNLLMVSTLETLDLFERDSLNGFLRRRASREAGMIDKKMLVVEEKLGKVKQGKDQHYHNSNEGTRAPGGEPRELCGRLGRGDCCGQETLQLLIVILQVLKQKNFLLNKSKYFLCSVATRKEARIPSCLLENKGRVGADKQGCEGESRGRNGRSTLEGSLRLSRLQALSRKRWRR